MKKGIRATGRGWTALRRLSSRRRARNSFPIKRTWSHGFLDHVEVDPCGIIRLIGWSTESFKTPEVPVVRLDGQIVPFLHHFRFTRNDVPAGPDASFLQTGLAIEYLIAESSVGRASTLWITIEEVGKIVFKGNFCLLNPHYRGLLNSTQVYHREHIYGSGPPNALVNPELLELAKQLEGPVLDFGCGRGGLSAELRSRGVEVHGLELDTEIIREAISQQDAKFFSLYDGSFPTPFQDGAFRSVMCSEVLEHIPSYQAAVAEIARISTKKAIFTVPDASAIAVGFSHGAIPWHLLEGTHVNFFTQESLRRTLEPHFSKIDFGRVGLARFNESAYYVSLVAVCLK